MERASRIPDSSPSRRRTRRAANLRLVADPTGNASAEQKAEQDRASLTEREAALREALVALRTSHEDLKATQLQLIQAAKLDSIGRLAAGVAHEVKNPLAIILVGTEYLLSRPELATGETRGVLDDMRVAVQRANTVISGLLNYSASTDLSPTTASINGVVEQSLHLVQHALNRGHVQVHTELAPGLPPLMLDVAKIEQVMINLLINAIDAMESGGTLTIRTRRTQLSATDEAVGYRRTDPLRVGESVVVTTIEDTGTGIPEANLTKVFDPFFTTKPTGKGTGLGLAVSKTILALHGGTLRLANRSGGGTIATIVLRSATV